MELKSALLGDIPLLAVTGDLDRNSSGTLAAALQQRLEARHNIVFLDLSDATSIDSAGVSVLREWVQALGGRGWLGVIAPNIEVHRLLEGTELLRHPNVCLFETKQAARIATGERQST
jgi:anti-anti-sigma factor